MNVKGFGNDDGLEMKDGRGKRVNNNRLNTHFIFRETLRDGERGGEN